MDSKDWIAAFTAAAQGKKSYEGSQNAVDELDNVPNAVPYTKPMLVIKGRKYKVSGCVVCLRGQPLTPPAQLLKDPVIIGRSSACTIVIGSDKKVSREHCKVENRGPSKWVVSDMGSNSGTRVNGNKVTQQVLKKGDVIEVGSASIVFRAK